MHEFPSKTTVYQLPSDKIPIKVVSDKNLSRENKILTDGQKFINSLNLYDP